jgi:hypothetical protein
MKLSKIIDGLFHNRYLQVGDGVKIEERLRRLWGSWCKRNQALDANSTYINGHSYMLSLGLIKAYT